MAVDQEARDLINDILAAFATRPDGGTWGVPADFSVLIRQDQPPASGTSQFKVEDVPMAAQTLLLREAGDIAGSKISALTAHTPVATDLILGENAAGNLRKYDAADLLGGGSGDVVGPASSTDNAAARFNLATGKLLQDGTLIIGDTGNLSGIGNITLSGTVDGRDVATDGTKLDGIASGANNYSHPNHTGDVTSTGDGATVIAAKAVDVAMLADGTDGELVTWGATGVAETVAVGTSGHVLTSNGVGAAPTFQAGGGGGGDTHPMVDTTDLTKGLAVDTRRFRLTLNGDLTPSVTMKLNAAITANRTVDLPDATDTLVGKATTDTLTNKSIDAGQLTGSIVDARVQVSNVTQHVASIDHDALLNFLAAEHVDWAGASAGTIHTTNFVALQNIVEDTTPQLGGMLDVNTFSLGDGTNKMLDFVEGGTANYFELESRTTGNGPILRAVGTDAIIDFNVFVKSTGKFIVNTDAHAASVYLKMVSSSVAALGTGGGAGTLNIENIGTIRLTQDADGTLLGGISSGNDLILRSTSHATKGRVLLGITGGLTYDEVNDIVGIGISSPSGAKLHIRDTGGNILCKLEQDGGPAKFEAYTYATSVGNQSQFLMHKARGSLATPAAVASGDNVGLLNFKAYSTDSTFYNRASIGAVMDAAPSGSSVPMKIDFVAGTTAANVRGTLNSAGAMQWKSWWACNNKTPATPPNYTRSGSGTNRSIDYAFSSTTTVRQVLATLVQDLIDIGLLS